MPIVTPYRSRGESRQPLRIAFLTPEFVTEKKFDGGLANYLARVTPHLATRGHSPEVFVTTPDVDVVVSDWHQNVLVHRLPSASTRPERTLRQVAQRATRRDYPLVFRAVVSARRLSKAVTRRHRQKPFDVIQVADFLAGGLLLPSGVPIVTRLSWFAPTHFDVSQVGGSTDKRLYQVLEARAVRRSTSIFAPSTSTAAIASRWFGRSVDVVHSPIETLDIPTSTRQARAYALFVGRLCRLKGVFVLAEALRACAAVCPEFRLLLVGREETPGILDEIKRRAGSAARCIDWIDRVPHDRLIPIIRDARFVVLPSLTDNFPNAALEAMALGKAVIGTRETGFDDLIVDGETGSLVDPGNAASLADVLIEWWTSADQKLAAIGGSAAESLKRFAPEIVIPQLVALYEYSIGRQRMALAGA
jgi:glycosyltransferase involved in cell wall biosynthesis